jgi:glucoamylase
MKSKHRDHTSGICQFSKLSQKPRLNLQLISVISILATLPFPPNLYAAEAPCPPGYPSVWASAVKDFIGTSNSPSSQVYFTGADGILTEVFYPTVDTVQNVDMQFLVTDAGKTWGDEERKQTLHNVTQANKRAMLWKAETTDNNGKWKISKRIFSDPGRNAVIQRVTFQTLESGKGVKDYNLYLLNNPAINSTGAGAAHSQQCGGKQNIQAGPDDSSTQTNGGRTLLVASEPKPNSADKVAASALAVSLPWRVDGGNVMVSNGYVGTNDGFTDLFAGTHDRTMDWRYDKALAGNVAQMGWIDFGANADNSISFDVVLGFGASEAEAMNTANAVLNSDLTGVEKTYADQWQAYTVGLNNQNGTADDQYYLAAMTLKSIQDKTNGAMIAGPGTPWGDSSGDANKGGYHIVWSRDLFKFASALIAAGDKDTANQAVNFLFNKQVQADGHFPQNTFVNGQVYWKGIQMDEAAMPIILAWKLNRVDLWSKIKPTAEYLAKNGPRTGQERWEEMGGYSPSTIAAEIAGLVCAADLATQAGDPGASAYYLQKADEWRNNIANWTFTTNGSFGNNQYYIRIDDNQDPNDRSHDLNFGNGGGPHKAPDVIDGGFLELVRMGAMSPNDWTILETIPEYDLILKQTIAGKDAWFRYNYDGYGEKNNGDSYTGNDGRGRLWPIFTAERGIYEVSKAQKGSEGVKYLQDLKGFSSPVGFIPEQVWNNSATITNGWQTITPAQYKPGDATRSMRPLSWAMGEYINLTAAINSGHGDAPSVVCQRYACDQPQVTVNFKVNATTTPGENIYLLGNSPLLSNWIPASGIKLSPKNYPQWTTTISLPANAAFEYKFVKWNGAATPVWETGSNHAVATKAGSTVINLQDNFQ